MQARICALRPAIRSDVRLVCLSFVHTASHHWDPLRRLRREKKGSQMRNPDTRHGARDSFPLHEAGVPAASTTGPSLPATTPPGDHVHDRRRGQRLHPVAARCFSNAE